MKTWLEKVTETMEKLIPDVKFLNEVKKRNK